MEVLEYKISLLVVRQLLPWGRSMCFSPKLYRGQDERHKVSPMSKKLVFKLPLEGESDSPFMQPVPAHQPKGPRVPTQPGKGPGGQHGLGSATLELHLVLPRAVALLCAASLPRAFQQHYK